MFAGEPSWLPLPDYILVWGDKIRRDWLPIARASSFDSIPFDALIEAGAGASTGTGALFAAGVQADPKSCRGECNSPRRFRDRQFSTPGG